MQSDGKRAPAKVTYATMGGDQMIELHLELDRAIEQVKKDFGQTHPVFIDGRAVEGAGGIIEDRSPIDTRILVGRFTAATREQTQEAIAAARTAFPAWSRLPWEERVHIVRRIGRKVRERRAELSAVIGYEAGKSRLECVGEVEEAADFFDYYCDRMDATDGFTNLMGMPGSSEESRSVLRPYGVFGIIAPFNFPLALAAGPTAAALLAGNTIVCKPAEDTPLSGAKFYDIVSEFLPAGVFNLVNGPGIPVGQELANNAGVDGLVFTGSMEVGMRLLRDNGARSIPRPLIIEMGGKNPALVMGSADLDRASDGVMRSAFGATGQKCSACSRVYVDREVRGRFVELLVEKVRELRVGNPLERDVWTGPVINERAVQTYENAIAQAKRDGGRILTGGRRMMDEPFNHGYFVEPTVIDGLPKDHPLFTKELFVPITVVGDVLTLDEAIDLANRTEYGLTAGIFTQDDREIEEFFDRIQAGVVYANRRAGATSGAWPGQNSFGGWKASGSTGKGTGGPHYVQQFFREQSRTRAR
ncbi:MAG TPA: aldehyde dehydrogenase family protein [Vicinamibacterales bacterium]|jgi:1-pyrroline-5-carboxylate dehydrogenase